MVGLGDDSMLNPEPQFSIFVEHFAGFLTYVMAMHVVGWSVSGIAGKWIVESSS